MELLIDLENITNSHDDELQLVTSWDFNTEALFIFILSILSIPANFLLILFFGQKIKFYKKCNKKAFLISNCYYTYLIEIISFDTVISIHLFVNTIFQLLYNLEKTQYESVFDVSHFTCKFFIYALRISSAMCSWLTFLLTFNRFMLLFQIKSDRLCINTKYSTLFLFCICTIANVFRLELLHINNSTKISNLTPFKLVQLNITNSSSEFDIGEFLNDVKITTNIHECGINTRELIFNLADQKHLSVFWSIIVYNLIFSIIPAIGNFIISIYLIRKHSFVKQKIILNDFEKLNEILINNKNLILIKKQEKIHKNKKITCNLNSFKNFNLKKQKNNEYYYYIEFLNTCIPCITISCLYFICYLPYTCLETLNQTFTTLLLFKYTIYINYFRYLFHGCKFYLLFFVSYKFRKDILIFLKYKKYTTIINNKQYSLKNVIIDDDNNNNDGNCNREYEEIKVFKSDV